MGGCDFECVAFGKDMGMAFRNAVAQAEIEDGTDCYNGTISTTHLVNRVKSVVVRDKVVDLTERLTWVKIQKVQEFCLNCDIAMPYAIEKCDCMGIELVGKIGKLVKRGSPYKGKKGIKAFYFFGIAAC